ncbi:SET and MYND domain-containing protein 4 [Sabethes cyaneus]|uniref:SET and MYND domain-containing protein 4 n=1 Tax=Sabethes cyaneus TaxID=53552 RepID=UPI00237DC671|nr:SET and MYND domain-containing protein 4 [Sabethes cyaneus]XP_053683938.1 SET and MYND domain-containing protein 4 [Sabethes cyaneus]XP_053683939.1 SET and MYND domain-containing protein 4 [Sabethes cyaneus]
MDAYDLYSAVWRRIVISGKETQVTSDLKACRTNIEIINYVHQIVKESGLMDQIQFKEDAKNEAKAIVCRKKGNDFFNPKIKRYIKAIECYNESIALCEPGSEALAIAYANRSAICFELKEYRDCLENIRLAEENPYPGHLIPKLNKRKTDCLSMLNNNLDESEEQKQPKLCNKPNRLVPHVSDCLELKEDDKFGRYLITNRNLCAGDLVVIEKPFSFLLAAKLRYLNCDFCQKDRFLTLIPCSHCTVTMFCSEICRQKAQQGYHRIECPGIRNMQQLFTKVILMAMRTTTTAIATFNFDLNEMQKHLQSIENLSVNPFQLDWNTISAKEIYNTIHKLATNQNLRTASDLTQRSVYAIILSDILLNKSPLKHICGSNESHSDLIRNLLFHHAQTAPVNMHSMMYMDYCPEENEQFQQAPLGCGSFPILSNINHSCAPNLVRITLPNGHVAALINRPIKKGDQLYDNYGYHHCLETLSERQIGLRGQYCFRCQCEACKNNYPLYYDLGHANLPPFVKNPIINDELDGLRKHDIKTALKKIPDYCQFLNAFDDQYPNYELSSVQEALLRCFQIVYACQTRKLKYKKVCSL